MGRPPGRELLEQKLFRLRRIDPATGCWLYTGATHPRSGHGSIWMWGKLHQVHRIAYTHFKGEPEGLVCHIKDCKHANCFNPEHLYDGTHSSNLLDAYCKGER